MDFKVTRMKCEGCVSAVKVVISGVEGTAGVDVNLETGMVHIDGDDVSVRDEVFKRLAAAGYPPEVAASV